MKTYHLTIMGGGTPWTEQVQADHFYTSSGYYGFKDDKNKLVACYPIERTIISKITEK